MTTARMSTARQGNAVPEGVIDVGDGFFNLRGSFKIGGLLDVGTHASLVQRASGGYVMLDAIGLTDAQRRFVDERTEGGRALEAILHLHPFHTVSVEPMARAYPGAKLYGTARHHRKAPSLTWEPLHTDDPALHARFADVLAFTVPRGVDLVPDNENVHFASVIALHRASRTIHVDDTITYVRLPKLLRGITPDVMRMHPMLRQALQPRAGAADELDDWLRELVRFAEGADNLCAAHSAVILARSYDGAPIRDRVERATRKVRGTIDAHRAKYG
ncbi:MAG: hypothetical protein AB7S26_39015 [Sandaracinaceae bacterium]